jgi:hypothetical protein
MKHIFSNVKMGNLSAALRMNRCAAPAILQREIARFDIDGAERFQCRAGMSRSVAIGRRCLSAARFE